MRPFITHKQANNSKLKVVEQDGIEIYYNGLTFEIDCIFYEKKNISNLFQSGTLEKLDKAQALRDLTVEEELVWGSALDMQWALNVIDNLHEEDEYVIENLDFLD